MPIDTNEQSTSTTPAASRLTTPVTDTSDTSTTRRFMKFSTFDWRHITLSKAHKIWLGIGAGLTLILVIVGVLAFKTLAVVKAIQAEGVEARALAQQGYAEFKGQNLPGVKDTLNKLDEKLVTIDGLYDQLSFYKGIPIASNYYNDGLHGLAAGKAGLSAAQKSIDSITPYADVLGFTGEGTFTGGTTEDRLKIILETLQKITPELDLITADLETVRAELASIDANRYPEQIRGTEVRSNIIQAQEYSAGAVNALTNFRPVIEQLPAIAGGNDEPKKYLVLFQNDNELRPTGGFLTAYAIIKVENGKVIPEKSDDIYELDKKFNKRLPIPEALGRYLTTERYWNLRDMNISPDFKTSMDTFYEHYSEVPGEPDDIDGIIAVDTEFLKALMTMLGPVNVPGYGTFSGENVPQCDCPQIIYALSEIITRPVNYIKEDRKGILGPLMREMLTKAYGAPKQQWPSLFELGWQSIQNRHIQFYFIDEQHQASAELINGAGRMTPPENGEDFIGIVNANLGGAKSNLFTEYEVKQTVAAPVDGRIEKTVDITYRNTRKGDNCNLEAGLLCLNSTLRDWTRLYLPAGAQLVSANGFTAEPKTYDEAGFSVIDGFFILEPNSSAKVTITYTVPYAGTENYILDIWKQGGIKEYKLLMDVTGGEEELLITKDTQYKTVF
ncbi:MAG: hypothetical protein QG639_169 [Patescibacteria group bacterium]|nr:hypothetical protein [Patescibacteria group bacterium]